MKRGWPDGYLVWTDTRGETHRIPYWYGEGVRVVFTAPDDPPDVRRVSVDVLIEGNKTGGPSG